MRRIWATFIGLFLTLMAYIFDIFNLQTWMEANNYYLTLRFPPMEIIDWVWSLVFLATSVCTLVLAIQCFPGIRVSNLVCYMSKEFGFWFGVNVVRRGFDAVCTAQAEIRSASETEAPTRITLRTKNQWEQKKYRENQITPFNLRQIPKFLPMMRIDQGVDPPMMEILDQTEEQWFKLIQGVYKITIEVSHESIFPRKKIIYVEFDGSTIKTVSARRFRRDKKNFPRTQRTLEDIGISTSGLYNDNES